MITITIIEKAGVDTFRQWPHLSAAIHEWLEAAGMISALYDDSPIMVGQYRIWTRSEALSKVQIDFNDADTEIAVLFKLTWGGL